MFGLMVGLITGAVVLALIGFVMLLQVNVGTGLIVLACLLAVLARIAQASLYRKEAQRKRESLGIK